MYAWRNTQHYSKFFIIELRISKIVIGILQRCKCMQVTAVKLLNTRLKSFRKSLPSNLQLDTSLKSKSFNGKSNGFQVSLNEVKF